MDIPSLVARIISEDPDNNRPDPSKMAPVEIFYYTENVLHGKRWPEAEPYIKKEPIYAYYYARNILHGERFFKAEPYIMKSPQWAYEYIKDILFKKPWPEAEPYIAKNPQIAYLYAKNILNGKRFPEAEPYIKKNPRYAYYYAKDILEKPWPEAEPYIAKDPKSAYEYARDMFHGKRWPEAEPYIAKSPLQAYKYIIDILHGEKWPKAEPYIAKNPKWAYEYAKYVLHGKRFPEAEPYIKKNPILAYKYAKDILHKRWPEAESYIKNDLYYWGKYKHFLRELEELSLNRQINKSKFFKYGYKVKYLPDAAPGELIKEGELFTLLISSLEPDVEKAIPKELYSLFDLHSLSNENKLDKFIGWIGGTITDDAVWIQEIQSDLLQRTWQLQSKEKFIEKKNKQLEKKKELLNQLQDELNRLLDYYQYPPLSKAYGLEEKIELLKQEQEKLKKEIKNAKENEVLEFYPEYAKFKSKLENLYLKWIEAFYHIVIWYAKKFNKDKLYIISSDDIAELWDRDVGGEGSVYYRAYDGIAKKLGAKLVTIDYRKWWLLELDSFTPMESKNYQK